MTTAITIVPLDDARLTSRNKCGVCRGKTCCTYFTQQIDAPCSIEDFDLLLWQISHLHTQVYKDDEGWFLLVNNRCMHLQPDGGCGIYETRPQVCREHSNDECEFEGPCAEDDFELFFPDYAALLGYCRKRFKSWDRRYENSVSKHERR